MNNSDMQRLSHICLYCRDISNIVERCRGSKETFCADRVYFHAATMCLLQIGELVGGLSIEFRKETSCNVQWGMIKGMRNFVAHQYAELDERTVWETISIDVPALLKFCDMQLQAYQPQCNPNTIAEAAAAAYNESADAEPEL